MHLARQCPPSGVSAARQRVPRGDSGGPERRPRDDHPELALFGGRPLARRCGGDAGGIAGGSAAGGRDRAGIDAQRRGRSVLRRMAAGSGDGLCAALLSLVVGAQLPVGHGGGDRRVERGRSGAGRAVRAGRGADRVPKRDAGELRSAICRRVPGRCRELLSHQRRMRVRPRDDRAADAGAGSAGRERAKRMSANMVAGAGGQEIRDWSRPGGRQRGRRLLMRAGAGPGGRECNARSCADISIRRRWRSA